MGSRERSRRGCSSWDGVGRVVPGRVEGTTMLLGCHLVLLVFLTLPRGVKSERLGREKEKGVWGGVEPKVGRPGRPVLLKSREVVV